MIARDQIVGIIGVRRKTESKSKFFTLKVRGNNRFCLIIGDYGCYTRIIGYTLRTVVNNFHRRGTKILRSKTACKVRKFWIALQADGEKGLPKTNANGFEGKCKRKMKQLKISSVDWKKCFCCRCYIDFIKNREKRGNQKK